MTTSPDRLTVVGLGTGTWESLTVEAADILLSADEIYVRTAVHPSLTPIAERLPDTKINSFDSLYESLNTLSDVYVAITDSLVGLVNAGKEVVYAVPGSPSLGETTVRELTAQLPGAVRIVQGISLIEPVLSAVGVADAGWIEVIDAAEADLLSRENALGEVNGEVASLPLRIPVPTATLIVSFLFDRQTATGVKLWLSRYYPDEHAIQVVRAPGTPQSQVMSIPLYELDRLSDVDHRTCLYVPPLREIENVRTFSGLMWLTRTLRAPGGCPWDREQTHETLKPHLLEETYEVLDALDRGDPAETSEEMGDLLFQVMIHSQIAAEHGEFSIEDVIQNIMVKLIGRHPHVFGDAEMESAQDVREAWEALKQREKPKRASVLEQIPHGLPALPQSNLMQKRAASVGFEWPSVEEVLDKVEEEIEEIRVEIRNGSAKELQREELGDILFALVSVARHLKIDPEEALRLANRKFAARFQYVGSRVSAEGKTLRDLSAEQLDEYWSEAKALGTAVRS